MEVQSCDGYKATLSKSDRSSFIFVSKALFIASDTTQFKSTSRRVEFCCVVEVFIATSRRRNSTHSRRIMPPSIKSKRRDPFHMCWLVHYLAELAQKSEPDIPHR